VLRESPRCLLIWFALLSRHERSFCKMRSRAHPPNTGPAAGTLQKVR
jgi:hypothetical protein